MSGCKVERKCRIERGSLNMATGETELAKVTEWSVGPCGVPLFGEDAKGRGVCSSCLGGWTHAHNFPTDAGKATIAAAWKALNS